MVLFCDETTRTEPFSRTPTVRAFQMALAARDMSRRARTASWRSQSNRFAFAHAAQAYAYAAQAYAYASFNVAELSDVRRAFRIAARAQSVARETFRRVDN